MKLVLTRTAREYRGVFGTLVSDDGSFKCVTLEHAYPVFDGNFASKIAKGEYTCVRGMHRLEGMRDSFETFEITGVPGHSDILFHVGNTNIDSSGCVLLGKDILEDYGNVKMITDSRITFEAFMKLMTGIDSFQLIAST